MRTNKIEGIEFPYIIPKINMGYMAAPALLSSVPKGTFKKTQAEKELLWNLKLKNKEERKKHYGKDYKKYLNIPSNSFGTIKMKSA